MQSLIIQGLSVIMVFAGNLLLARWAGADDYGKYVHIFNWISILGVIATGGREDLVLTELTQYHHSGQPGRIGLLIKRTNAHVLIASLLLGFLFITIITIFPIPALHEYRLDFLIAWGAVYFMAFLSLNQFILQSLNYIRLSQITDRLIRPFLIILLFGILLVLGYHAGSRPLIVLVETDLGICCLILAVILLKKTKPFFEPGEQVLPRDNLTRKTLYFFSITMMTLIITKISMLVLPYFAPRRDIGIFNVSYRFADLVVYPFFLMHSVLPQLFARHTFAEVTYKQSLYNSSTKMMTALCLPLLLVNVLAGRFLLGLFGKDFTAGYTAMILLSVSQFFYSLFGPANTILMMQNREKQSAICLLVYVVLLLVSNLLLVPLWGVTGGAVAMLVSCLIYNIILAVQAYRLSGVISPFFAFLAGKGR